MKEVKVEIDYYTPINIVIGVEDIISKEDIIYWSVGNANKSLLEIGIGEKSGELMKITLVAVDTIDNSKKIDLSNVPIMIGIPIFSMDEYENLTYNSKIKNFNVNLSIESINIIIDNIERFSSVVSFGRVNLVMNEKNQICIIQVTKLTSIEYKDLKDSFRC